MLLIPAALLLVACAMPVADESSPRYRVPVGSVVVLHQDLVVPEGHARVFLQGGALVEKHRLKAYYPHCNFEQRAVSDGTAVIRAGRYTVTAVRVGEDWVVREEPRTYAALTQTVDGGMDDGYPGLVNRRIDHALESPHQPQVMRLTCHGGFEVPGKAEYPSLVDIRYALGSVATVEAP
jgi:hypothetical protein